MSQPLLVTDSGLAKLDITKRALTSCARAG